MELAALGASYNFMQRGCSAKPAFATPHEGIVYRACMGDARADVFGLANLR